MTSVIVANIVSSIDAGLRAAPQLTTAAVRQIRRRVSKDLTSSPDDVLHAVALALTQRDRLFDRFIAAELIAEHPTALRTLSVSDLRRLGRGMDSWGDVDVFACFLAGQLWRMGRVSDAEIHRWARASDRWWRRAGVVSTVPLNNRARGGSGDAARTLGVCRLVVDDRDPMVVKALSWALRELAKQDPVAAGRFLEKYEARVAGLVHREVTAKLETGRKR